MFLKFLPSRYLLKNIDGQVSLKTMQTTSVFKVLLSFKEIFFMPDLLVPEFTLFTYIKSLKYLLP